MCVQNIVSSMATGHPANCKGTGPRVAQVRALRGRARRKGWGDEVGMFDSNLSHYIDPYTLYSPLYIIFTLIHYIHPYTLYSPFFRNPTPCVELFEHR